MGENKTFTLEFKEESDVPNEEDLEKNTDLSIKRSVEHGKYLSLNAISLFKDTSVDASSSVEDRVRYLFDNTDATRIAYSWYQNTSNYHKVQLYKREENSFTKIAETDDMEATKEYWENSSFKSSEEIDPERHRTGQAIKKIKEDYNFDVLART